MVVGPLRIHFSFGGRPPKGGGGGGGHKEMRGGGSFVVFKRTSSIRLLPPPPPHLRATRNGGKRKDLGAATLRNGCPPPPSSLLSEQPPIQVRVTLFLADLLMFFRGLTHDSTLIPARHLRFFLFCFSPRLGSREMVLPRPPARCTRYKLPLLSHPLPIINIFPGRRTLAS